MPITDQFDYNIDAGFGGPVPFISPYLGDLRFFVSFRRDRELYIVLWGGYVKVRDPKEAVWHRGDPFTGDPPQEPQGRNSVFTTDTLTLYIFKKYASMMNDLNQ
jgi:hypothetical protein